MQTHLIATMEEVGIVECEDIASWTPVVLAVGVPEEHETRVIVRRSISAHEHFVANIETVVVLVVHDDHASKDSESAASFVSDGAVMIPANADVVETTTMTMEWLVHLVGADSGDALLNIDARTLPRCHR